MNRISLSLLAITTFACSSLVVASPNEDLFLAVIDGNLAKASAAVNAGAKIDGEPGEMSPLYVAAFLGQTDVTEYLLKKGADPMIVHRSTGVTPIQIAALKGHKELSEMLRAHALGQIEKIENLLKTTKDQEQNRDCEDDDTVTFDWMGQTYAGPRGQVHDMGNGGRVVANPWLPSNPKRQNCKNRP